VASQPASQRASARVAVPLSPSTARSASGDLGRPVKMSERVARTLAAHIVDQDLAPGTPLPSEKELIETFGMARTTVREALRLLETRGVITIRSGPGGGPVVRRPGLADLSESLSLMMQFQGTTLEEVMRSRAMVETSIIRLAATRIGADQLARLQQVSAELAEVIEDDEAFGEGNTEYHDIIAEAAGNLPLRIMLASIGSIADGRSTGIRYTSEVRRSIVEDHDRIVEALAARDVDAAELAMRDHLDTGLQFWKQDYPDLVTHVIRWDL
jgi:DNA-binding FadR family transcriptional regulator